MATRKCETLDIHPTDKWVIIPVTSASGRAGFIRRQLWASDDGRMFVLNGTSFDEVRQDARGTYRLVNIRFMDGEWHFGETGVLVKGPAPAEKTPIWVVPNAPARKREDDYGMSF